MSTAIIGIGLISPGGTSASEHVFFLRAGVAAPAVSPFLDPEDRRIDVRHCPWLGARMGMSERLATLATAAVAETLGIAREAVEIESAPVMLCVDSPRPGLGAEEIATLRAVVRAQPGCDEVLEHRGAAGAFAALAAAAASVESGRTPAALVLAVDSHVSLEFACHHAARPGSLWRMREPPPSEGAAAVLLMNAALARRLGSPVLGRFHGAVIERGAAHDDNDEPTDGTAMTAALRAVQSPGRLGMALGQHEVDDLRMRDWHFASARNAARFADSCTFTGIEPHVGRLGAASGLANLVWGLAMLRHDAQGEESARRAPFCAWTLSRDGVRGVAVASWEAR